ncbi:hypothetical protein H6G96_31580 [Nostoc sp. FACHB-892]|uniref:hypothetical protein n=1 Tax=Nostoc sp. FACHB-892 TaxID=2692843 RepID=UPI001686E66D|nr:hypothetical protein [Nostoc sp. FACHB-892]MBD2730738.1 hypothetical protein [Nostoc sp. FACHB-892]
MLTAIVKPEQSQVTSDRFSGEFDAAIGLPPKTTEGEYWAGYLRKVAETGVTPF